MDIKQFDSLIVKALGENSEASLKQLANSIKDMGPAAGKELLADCINRAKDLAINNSIPIEKAFEVVQKVADIVISHVDIPQKNEAYFFPSDQSFNAVRNYILSARQTLDICVFTITDNRLRDAIFDCHRRGVKVRIITDDEKANDLGSDIDWLTAKGLPIRKDKTSFFMHNKFAIIDSKLLINGSFNWTTSASQNNNENVTVTDYAQLTASFVKYFNNLWKQFE